ncbi:MAG: HD domain-containing protein [Gammaproteobacteria bacterium]|nr:HD domain-containing protein [Gammaproteobacteria bacterium]MBU1414145.1 HD domain-containing protein [Gammaproteobacteria bacterium]
MPWKGISSLKPLSMTLAAALHERDEYTFHHGNRVMRMALAVGRRLGLVLPELNRLHVAALLHDVGKIGIPDEVLLKPGAFDEPQRTIMRSHADRGEKLLRTFAGEDAEQVAIAIRHHHEDFDGTGYPDNLDRENIPVLSRIISIADNYDAMASKRVYHRACNHDHIVGVMLDKSGQKHDPYLLRKFLEMIEHSPLRVS